MKNKYVIIDSKENIKLVENYFEPLEKNISRLYNVGSAYGLDQNSKTQSRIESRIYELDNLGMTEITMDEFKTLVGKPKKLKGYRVKPRFINITARTFGTHFGFIEDPNLIHFAATSEIERLAIEAEVIDIWFDKIYLEDCIELPTLNGRKGEIQGEYVSYGCQKVHKSLFNPDNCVLESLKIYGVRVKEKEIEQIRKFLKFE